jgi:peptide-methionine (S)-S-oxide reductase
MDGGTVRLARLIGHSHALDMILTARAVSGEEALRVGLANRLVPTGKALEAAIGMAKDIAKFPQVCLRSDRLSSYEQWSLGVQDALNAEFHHGMDVIRAGGMFAGLETFATTTGRHGSLRHVLLGTPMLPPYPAEMETALFAMGPFWGPERLFWQVDGVYTTAVGYAGSDHTEVVRVVFDPRKTCFDALLRVFWEGHDPTHAARAGSDGGGQHRSAIFCTSPSQRQAAEASRRAYQQALSAAGAGTITTEIADAPEFKYAEDAQQQYLARDPSRHVSRAGTGVRVPIGD